MSDTTTARNGPWLGMVVAGESNPGGRKHMEDYIVLKSETETKGQAFFAVFDGHGGKEAAKYARNNLWQAIKDSEGFYSGDPVKVTQAIAAGFVKTHEDMWKVRDSWKKTKGGDPSTSGTTVACAIVQQDRMYIANVGDSTIVLGKANPKYGEAGEPEVIAEVITRDHKPEDKKEKRRIEALGGAVSLSNKGVMRVVWERKRPVQTKSRIGETCHVDKIPFLSVARSLGDLWSVTKHHGFLISPVPDVYIHYFDLTKDKFIILASDGLWNMLKPQETVETVYHLCKSGVTNKVEASKAIHVLINNALERWNKRNLTADNISALIGFFRAIHDEHLSDGEFECDSLQTSCNLGKPVDSAKQKLGKRAKQTDCLSLTSPKKPSIMDKPPDVLKMA